MVEATGQKGKSDFLSTHPADATRIARIKKEIPGVLEKYGK
jgi:Zn-dependent protease with chaperone function